MGIEYLDIYDENENLIGKEDRSVVHQKGLWHKTTHCWVLKQPNMILFQQRSPELKDNPGKLYTTASGHLSAGETPKEGLKREVAEECGVDLDTSNAKKIDRVIWKGDFVKTDGTEFHDRVFAEIYLLETDKELTEFDFQEEELGGIFAVPVTETLEMFKSATGSVNGYGVIKEDGKTKLVDKTFSVEDFITIGEETCLSKYGKVLESAKEYFAQN
ncbi:MAG: NUDIX domain-containing protein [Proteobacteria bacterium]|nr:NUDIX domain-containing protein [Pseudomonadota bacterium]